MLHGSLGVKMKDSIIMYNMDALKLHSLPLCMLQRSPALHSSHPQSTQFFFFFFFFSKN